MDRIPPRISPPIPLLLIDNRVHSLEIWWVLQEGVVLVRDVLSDNLLLDVVLPPVVVIQPGVGDVFNLGCYLLERIRGTSDIEVDPGKKRRTSGSVHCLDRTRVRGRSEGAYL